ncbi:MAG: 50S ribosomal protein L13 [Parachlamydiales bacterium]
MSKEQHKRQTTYMARRQDVDMQWLLIDAEGKTLGRLASEITKVLRGKHKPTFTPHADTGDGVIVVNAEKIHVTGAKEAQKVYRRYSGYPGGMKETPYRVMLDRKPTFILEQAVRKMMPKKTRLSRAQLKRLRIFAGPEHNMEAQKPLVVA